MKKERKKEKTIILLESSVALLLFACNKNEKKNSQKFETWEGYNFSFE